MSDAKRRFAVLMLACAFGAIATSCGSSTTHPPAALTSQQPQASRPSPRKTYEAKMQVLGNRLAAQLAAAARGVSASSGKPTAIEHVLLTAQAQLRAAAAGLQRIKPPAKIKAQHGRLINAVREFAQELDGVIAGVKSGTGPAPAALIPKLKGLKDMQNASDAITKAGYAIVVQPK